MSSTSLVAAAIQPNEEANESDRELPMERTKKIKESGSLSRLEFVWDKVVIALMILAGTVAMVDNIERLVVSSSVECFAPNGTSRDQAAFINSYCYAFLPKKAYVPFYLPYFVVIGDSLIVGIHYLWVLIFEGHFRSFFGNVTKLELHRSPKTGTYEHKTMQVLEIMGKNTQSYWIIGLYIFKTVLQCILLFAAFAGFIYALLKGYEGEAFLEPRAHSFKCPPDDKFPDSQGYYIPEVQVPCVHTSREVLTSPIAILIHIILFGLSGLIALSGLAYLLFIQHANNLMTKEVAKFVFESPFLPEHYKLHNRRCRSCCCCTRTCIAIKNDLEFLVMALFRSNTGMGRLVRNIQIQNELNKLILLQSLHLHQPATPRIDCELQNKLYEKLNGPESVNRRDRDGGQELLLVCITFGTSSSAYMLYSAFKEHKKAIRVVIIIFDPYLESGFNTSSLCEGFITVIHVAKPIYSQSADSVRKFETAVLNAMPGAFPPLAIPDRGAGHVDIRRMYLVILPPVKKKTHEYTLKKTHEYTLKKIFTYIDTKKFDAGKTIFISLSDDQSRVVNPNECYIPRRGVARRNFPPVHAKCGNIGCVFSLVCFGPWNNSLKDTDHAAVDI